MVVVDWLVHMLGLPKKFLFGNGTGGGVVGVSIFVFLAVFGKPPS